VPRFVAFKNTRDIPRVGLAYAEAEGFIVPPGLPWSKKNRDERELDDAPAECPGGPDLDEDCEQKLEQAVADTDWDAEAAAAAEAAKEAKAAKPAESGARAQGGRKGANG
jgi:hypothetical protein